MTYVYAKSLNEGYTELVKRFKEKLKETEQSVTKGRNHGEFVELRKVLLEIEDPRKCLLSVPYRNASRRYMAGEFACYLQETKSKEFAYYSKMWAELDVDGTVQSNYGEKIFGDRDLLGFSRFDYACEQLKQNKDSKNAVIMMRDWKDNRPTYQKDRCCTLAIQFHIRNNKLDMEILMRSSDFWLGLAYDIFWFSFVQQRMLYYVQKAYGEEITLGTLLFEAASLHVYKKHWARIHNADLPYCTHKVASYIETTNYRDMQQFVDRDKLIIHLPENEYRFPEWNDKCEERLQEFLNWEKAMRGLGKIHKARGEQIPEEDLRIQAANLRGKNLPPFLETLGSFLLNRINVRYATVEDITNFQVASEIAKNSSCTDRKVGCLVLTETGRTHAAWNTVIQCDHNCDDKENRVCETKHAEINALELCEGEKPVKVWVTLYPCYPCMKAITAANTECEVIVMGFSHKGAMGTVTLLDPAYQPYLKGVNV